MNDEYRTIQNNMNTITKEEQELIASCERVGGDSRELARLSRRLIAGIENMGTLNGDLKAENVELVGLISNFCKQYGWSVDGWKNQRHVKPLFDIYEKAKETK